MELVIVYEYKGYIEYNVVMNGEVLMIEDEPIEVSFSNGRFTVFSNICDTQEEVFARIAAQ